MAPPRPPDPAAALLQEAVALHRAGELAAAAARYRRLLAREPRHADALNLLGLVFRQQGDLPQALRLIRRAVAVAPDAPVFLAALGGTLAEAGQLPEAVRTLRAALARRPEDAMSLRNLGQALCALGQPGAALAPLRQAVALAPFAAEAWLALAHAAREAERLDEAAAAAGRALEQPGLAAELAAQARFLLAALGQGPAPERAPAAYVRELFDQYAPRFEQELAGRLGYRTPGLLAELLRQHGVPAEGRLAVLDLGCGTGLSGRALRPFAGRLEGLDLSPRMLAEARRVGCYDALHEADLLDFLPRHPEAWDLLAAADVLNYLGDLAPALGGMAAALRPGGLAAFSVERGVADGYALGPGLRFRHDPALLRSLAARQGFHLVAEAEVVLRREHDAPVPGQLMLLRKDRATGA
ncbi:tetratricopeptide repeat protein [Teichococcus vastitatis]|uniref:tetratricopeptide repeat protein n=1 Tax=Teichococcus vastitatis TaxID=2307076 RepID=UPI000E70757D|nr:tetratricopeptide repeat protein [Pseudoroseomonas vastitatis]